MKVAFASLRNDRSLQILEGFQESEAPIHHQSPCSAGCQPRPTLPTWEAQSSSGAPVTGPVLSPCSPLLCSPDTLPQLRDPLGACSKGAALAVAVKMVPGQDANKKKSKYCTVGGVPVITRCPQAISSWPGKDNATHVLCTNTHTHACTHTCTQAHTQQAHTHGHFQTHSGPSTHVIGHTSTHTGHTHTVGRAGVRESEQQLRAQAVTLGGGGCGQVAEFLRAPAPHGCNIKDRKNPLCPDGFSGPWEKAADGDVL